MPFENDIKQNKPFENEHIKAVLNIIYTAGWAQNINAQFLKQFGLTPQQYNILRILRGQYPNPCTVNLLIDRMLDKMSNASRLVEKLRQKNYVERAESSIDRRKVDVIITQKGLELLSKIDKDFKPIAQDFSRINYYSRSTTT